jgi:NADH-quinone oxidoreductase subunit L
VIHALAGEQDIRKMGGVGRVMPFTRIAFLIGSLALVGVPPFAGFFSKDEIIAAALSRGWYGDILLAVALIGAFLTGVYAFRLYLIVFPGKPSPFVEEHVHEHSREGPFSMTSTVAVLTVLAVIGGLIQFEPLWGPVSSWLEPVAPPLAVPSSTQDALASLFAVLLGLAGIGVAWMIYGAKRWRVPNFAFSRRLLEHKFYFDEAYDFAFYRPAVALAKGLDRWFERPVISGSLKEIASGFREAGLDTSRIQTGLVRTYALAIAASLVVLMVVFVAVR